MAKKVNRNISKNARHGFNENEETVINKRNKIIVLVIFAILIVALCTSAWFAYSKYMSQIQGKISVQNANIICEMELKDTQNGEFIYNPNCTLEVRNYNGKGEVTKTNVKYTISVVLKDGTSASSYYWKDSSGQVVAQNSALEGSFTTNGQQSRQYIIVFVNSGEQISPEDLEFNLVAVQE